MDVIRRYEIFGNNRDLTKENCDSLVARTFSLCSWAKIELRFELMFPQKSSSLNGPGCEAPCDEVGLGFKSWVGAKVRARVRCYQYLQQLLGVLLEDSLDLLGPRDESTLEHVYALFVRADLAHIGR